jgi:hypothetical protein
MPQNVDMPKPVASAADLERLLETAFLICQPFNGDGFAAAQRGDTTALIGCDASTGLVSVHATEATVTGSAVGMICILGSAQKAALHLKFTCPKSRSIYRTLKFIEPLKRSLPSRCGANAELTHMIGAMRAKSDRRSLQQSASRTEPEIRADA